MATSSNPLSRLMDDWLPQLDFGVMAHGFARHGRDYFVVIQNPFRNPGTYELTFTHVVELSYQTRVADTVWPTSWNDEFTDYQAWLAAGEPDGYVWGTNWSNAYPGIEAPDAATAATHWAKRLGKSMFEASIKTDRFALRLVFHEVSTTMLSEDASTVRQTIHPLK